MSCQKNKHLENAQKVVLWCIMYVHMYVCMYVCMDGCMYVCMHVCMYGWMYACMHVCMYVWVSMYVCMDGCMYVCMHVCMYVVNRRLPPICISFWFALMLVSDSQFAASAIASFYRIPAVVGTWAKGATILCPLAGVYMTIQLGILWCPVVVSPFAPPTHDWFY